MHAENIAQIVRAIGASQHVASVEHIDATTIGVEMTDGERCMLTVEPVD